MKILVIVNHWPPDVNSTGLLMARLFGDLAGRGHQVQVITTFAHYQGFRTAPQYRGKFFERRTEAGVRITRVYSFTSGRKTMRHRLLNYLTFNLLATGAGLFMKTKVDLIFCTNGSFFSGLTGYAAGLRHRAPVVYNIQDLYPEVPVAQGQLTKAWQIKTLGGIERFMYRRSAALTVITPEFKANISAKGIPASKIEVIPNFVDTSFIKPLEKVNAFSLRHDLATKFVVSHAGNLGYVYDLATLLDAAALLRDTTEIQFLIVGDGVAKAGLVEIAEKLGLANTTFLPFQPYQELPWIRAASDVQVALYRAGASRYSMPSKLYEIMASGRPVLGQRRREE